jgi:cathepsin C
MKFTLRVIILLILAAYTLQDLPVHCLKHEIIGTWTLQTTDLYKVSSGHDMKCGHSEPSSENSSYLAESPYPLK